MRKLTNEEFLAKVHDIHGDEYIPLDKYIDAKSKIRVQHATCGRIFLTTPNNLYCGGCEICGYEKMKKAQRKTPEEFLDEIDRLVGNEYTFLDEYINNTTKLRVRHNICGHIYSVTPRDFLNGRRCPVEKKERIATGVTKTHEHFLSRLGNKLGDNYELLGKYVNGKTKIRMRCNKCGLIFDSLPGHILEGKGCPECWKEENGIHFRKSHETFLSQISEIWGNDYQLLSQYVKQSEKVEVLHQKCGRIFKATPDSLLRGSGCPHCKESHGEKYISSWLISHGIDFKPQYKFDDCVYKDRLRFDFAILENGTVVKLIEYQGIQHYKPIAAFGGEESFKIQQEKDAIKKNYAIAHNIELLEISYLDNIESKLFKLIPR